jgi:hypothetical protein
LDIFLSSDFPPYLHISCQDWKQNIDCMCHKNRNWQKFLVAHILEKTLTLIRCQRSCLLQFSSITFWYKKDGRLQFFLQTCRQSTYPGANPTVSQPCENLNRNYLIAQLVFRINTIFPCCKNTLAYCLIIKSWDWFQVNLSPYSCWNLSLGNLNSWKQCMYILSYYYLFFGNK